jgi:hypothetical protein
VANHDRYKAAAALAAVALLANCGDAHLPQPSAWQERARFGGDVRRVDDVAADAGGSLYFAVEKRDNVGTIYKYDGSTLKEVFRSRYADSTLGSVGCGRGRIWAAGTRFDGEASYAYCVRSGDGSTWEEVAVPADLGLGYLGAIHPAADGTVWFVGAAKDDSAVYTYRDGVWTTHPETAGAYALSLAVTARGRAFVYHVQNKVLKMLISDDGGASWTEERVSLDDPRFNFKRPSAMDMAVAGETVYLSGRLSSDLEGFDFKGVVGREDAPPGQGRYYVAFASPHGEYFYDISGMAFRTVDDGYCVGSQTSVRLKRGKWTKEIMPEAWNPQFDVVAAGPSSYWAVVGTSEICRDPVLYEAAF